MLSHRINSSSQSLAVIVALSLGLSLLASAAQASASQRSVDRAHAFLKTEKTGKDVLGFVHFGADYKGHEYLRTVGVVDQYGKDVADNFALVYHYQWDKDGETDIAFLCDARGSVYKVQVLKHNAIIQQPYALADITIQVVGHIVLDAFGDNMKPSDRAEVRKLIESSDSRGLLLAYLKFSQALN